jgi:hypothetical protein
MFENSVPPSPHPKTVQFRYSSVVERKYWTNTCGHCHAMFGNHYVQLEVGGTSFHEEEMRLYDQQHFAEAGDPWLGG